MAADRDVQRLRLLVDEPEDTLPYTDAALSGILDAADGDLNKAAFDVWTQKAAAGASLVNISEAGSSRSMGDLHKNALDMAKHFSAMVSGGTGADAPKATRVYKLRR